MYSIGLRPVLQGGLFLRLNTHVRSKSTSNTYNTEYLIRFKLKYEVSVELIFVEYLYNILEYLLKRGNLLSNPFNKISISN